MKISQIVLASTNMGKVAELAELLAGRGILVRPLSEFPGLPEIEETGSTFAENALIKARAVARASGLVAIADDSGLVVDA
ncbi:MAG: non-canonical purine NTP pyrophosphatase, partial [Desulfovibrio sp.]|nr:non-canonical purine NTP pyrophosphatase [Desulfovibrio sp.]